VPNAVVLRFVGERRTTSATCSFDKVNVPPADNFTSYFTRGDSAAFANSP